MTTNALYYGDNLDVLPQFIEDESVDLIYLDPPFNSNRSYNVLFQSKSGDDAQAQIEAFDDTWTWSQQAEELFDTLIQGGAPVRVADAIEAMRRLLGDNDVLAYLVMMTSRLVELHRVLKPNGSLYLHCDPTASHYLKVMLDAVFDVRDFRNEIVWKRTGSHGGAKRYGPVHDIILFYGKGSAPKWNQQYQPYDESYLASKFQHTDERGKFNDEALTGPGLRSADAESSHTWRGYNPSDGERHWQPASYAYDKFMELTGEDLAQYPLLERLDHLDDVGMLYWTRTGTPRLKRYLEDAAGVAAQDVWTDIVPINSQAAERLGYPTQKPLQLLERIIRASSDEGDVVLDPFCGCGTSVDAAQKLGRRWIGIDITYLAVDLIDNRLRGTFGDGVAAGYTIHGIPQDGAGAQALFAANPFDFERWAVSLVDGQPNQKQVGDKGVDGVIRFPLDNKNAVGRALVSVKGGQQLNPAMVRDLLGTVNTQRAEMGVLILQKEPTRGMVEAASASGSYVWPVTKGSYPKVQIITVESLLSGNRPNMPTPFLPYVQARRLVDDDQMTLGL